MTRPMSPDREREYAELFAFLDFFATNVKRIDPASEAHPSRAGIRIAEQYGRSKALEGLRQAVNDTVEDLADYSADFIKQLDESLKSQGIITFSEIRRRHSRVFRKIIKRGNIVSDTEYYLINGILTDCDSGISDIDRSNLESLVAQWSGA
jgi:hypothetical protein